MQEDLLLINGEWMEADNSNWIEVTNPATGEVIGRVPQAGEEETRRAVSAASAAFPDWAALTAKERAVYLMAAGELMVKRSHELAEILTKEQGKPLGEAHGEVMMAAEFMAWYAEEGKRIYGETIPASARDKRLYVQRQPIGVCAAITPWNFPAMMITRKVAPALAAGCTVVIKPASNTPLTAVAIVKIFQEAGFPSGVVNLVSGKASRISNELMNNAAVRKVSFTGSTEVGKLLMEKAAGQVKKVSLELGGHAPFIIFADADLDAAVQGLINNKFRNAGQTCVCTNRLYVEQSVAAELADKLKAAVAELRIGNGLDEGVQVGPVIDSEAISRIQAQVDDAVERGAKVLHGGEKPADAAASSGSFYQPTVLMDVAEDALIAHEETFGPVLPVWTFETEEEVIEKANDTEYGLAAYFYTRDLGRSIRISDALEYGIIGVNDPFPGVVQAPFGGMKESGIGREGGHHGIEEYLETKFVSVQI